MNGGVWLKVCKEQRITGIHIYIYINTATFMMCIFNQSRQRYNGLRRRESARVTQKAAFVHLSDHVRSMRFRLLPLRWLGKLGNCQFHFVITSAVTPAASDHGMFWTAIAQALVHGCTHECPWNSLYTNKKFVCSWVRTFLSEPAILTVTALIEENDTDEWRNQFFVEYVRNLLKKP